MEPTSTDLARLVLTRLVRVGVRDVVVCPGSRSAPLAYAAHALGDEGALRLHTRIDERTAGFLALGLARSSRRPVAVVTTSGTAVANLFPAVLEAAHSGVPLVAVTADRPAALRGTGSNQTADQLVGFGGAVRAAADLAAPGTAEADPGVWGGQIDRVLAAVSADPGPGHLTVQLTEPLVPDAGDQWAPPREPEGEETRQTPTRPSPTVLDPSPCRTVVVAGDDAGPPARVLAERAGWPLLAEPSSGSRTGTHAIRTYRLLLGDESLSGAIERVVVAGHPTLSRPITHLLTRDDVELVALEPPRGPVGRRRVTDLAGRFSMRAAALEVDGASSSDATTTADWLARWRTRDDEVSAALDELLDASPTLLPHHVAGAVARALPADGLLFLGASNPIRDLDLMVPRYPVGERRLVLANRGLAGIDGTVSSAIGAALGRPHSSRALALLGDVTFLHDQAGLVLGPDEPRPDLTIVVVNDDGGSIFAGLEPGAPEHAGVFERLFGTPHGADLAALCAASGTPHRRVLTRADLHAALAAPAGGIEVLEAVVDRTRRRELDRRIRALG